MRTNIHRLSPSTCGCVIEIVTYADDNNNPIDPSKAPEFLLMNKVCENHISLASTEHRPEHAMMSQNVMQIIEDTKAINLKQCDDLIAKATRVLEKEDLQLCRLQVLAHNAKITREWQELVTFPHAYDQHIHEQIKSELNDAKIKSLESNG